MTKRREPSLAELKAQIHKLKKERARTGGRQKMPARKRPRHGVFFRINDTELAFTMKEAAAHVPLHEGQEEGPTRAEVVKFGYLCWLKMLGYKESSK